MRYTNKKHALLRHAAIANAFREWLRNDGDQLVDAAELMGGQGWARCATVVVEAATEGKDLERRISELRALHRLLHLELVDDLESTEARFFARIDPDDPRADNARICAEAVSRGLQAIGAIAQAGVPPVREVA